MATKQKSYKEQLMELYGAGQNTAGAAQSGAAAQTGGATAQTGQSGNAMLDLILNRPGFSYDAKTDPAAQAARKEAARNAKLATEGTLGSYAGMTGGIPSTAAVSAAAQAGNAALQTGADKVAELKNLAYQNYQAEGQNMQGIAALMQQQEAADYARQQDEYQKQLAMAQLKASYGDLSGLKELGVDTSKYQSGGSGSGGGYTGGGSGGSGGGNGNGSNGGGTIPASVSDGWWLDYGGVLPADVWASAAAQYGEQTLIDAGFKKAAAQSPAPARPGKPGGGSNRVDLQN